MVIPRIDDHYGDLGGIDFLGPGLDFVGLRVTRLQSQADGAGLGLRGVRGEGKQKDANRIENFDMFHGLLFIY